MASAREMRLRIKSIKNISQVTRAQQAVSASKVRKAVAALTATRSYASKAWQVLRHIAGQPGRESLHPLLTRRANVKVTLVVVVSGDRGLAGAYYANLIRFVARAFQSWPNPSSLITVGRKGRDLLLRRGYKVVADFSNLSPTPSFTDVSAVGRMAVREFLEGKVDEVYLVYTRYVNTVKQEPAMKKLLPVEIERDQEQTETHEVTSRPGTPYTYEPSEKDLLDEIVPRFTALQVYQAILESRASEHAARMVAMHNATDNAIELVGELQLQYNKVRQQLITNEMLDIAGGAEALSQASAQNVGGEDG